MFSAGTIRIFAGNIFDLTPDLLGLMDGIYDRAALIALPEDLRRAYAAHLLSLTGPVPELLVTLDYDQSCLKGPPFPSTRRSCVNATVRLMLSRFWKAGRSKAA